MKLSKLLFYAVLFVQCFPLLTAAQSGKIDSSQTVTLRIDPQSARGTTISQLFDDVKFIPLETTKESLFGSISQLKIADNKFIIFDYDTKSILLFNNEGKFLTKIDAAKLQNDKEDKEKTQFYGFSTVKENGNEYITIFTEKSIQYFTLDGKFAKKAKNLEYSNDITLANGNVIVKPYMSVKKGNDSTFYKLNLINKIKKDTLSYFPYDNKMWEKDEWFDGGGITQYATDEAFYSTFYDYNLFKITPDKVSLAYKFILPAINTLPKDFLTNPSYVKKRVDFFQKNRKIIHGLGSTYLIGSNLYLRFSNVFWDKDQKKNLIYNIKTNDLISFQDLEPDVLSHFLPITDSGFGYDFENKGFLAFEKGKFYSSYSSLALLTFKERSTDKGAKYPPLLENFFKTGDRKSNPVLIVFTPKTN